MKRRCLLLLALAFALSSFARAAETVIHEYKAQCAVDERGRARMTVSVDLELSTAAATLDFPVGEGAGGVVSGLKAKRVKLDDGAVLRVKDEAGFTGRRTFVLSYSLGPCIEDTGEGQHLSVSLIAPGWQWPIESAAFSVTMPSEFTGTPVYTGGYHGDIAGDYWSLSQTSTSLGGSSTEELMDHDSLTLDLDLPKDYVRSGSGISETVSLIAVLAIAFCCLAYWFLRLYYPPVRPTLRPEPPENAGAGEIATLYSGAPPSLPLQIFTWASLGYVRLVPGKKGRLFLLRLRPMGRERRGIERRVFDKLFSRNQLCDARSARFAALCARWSLAAGDEWARRLFSRRSGSTLALQTAAALALGVAAARTASAGLVEGAGYIFWVVVFALLGVGAGLAVQEALPALLRRSYVLPAIAAILIVGGLVAAFLFGGLWTMLLALTVQVLAAAAVLRGGRRSRYGRESLSQALGFRRYLVHVSHQQLVNHARTDSQYFYKILPYAEALGLGKSLCERFGEVEQPLCDWLEHPRRKTASGFYPLFKNLLRRMRQKR